MYHELAPYYDEIFPASEAAVSFLAARSNGGAVLDVACGTGAHAEGLARQVDDVVAVDLDESMIKIARDVREGVRFDVADMTRLSETHLCDGPFDLIYCIGNSVVHLPDREHVGRFFDGAASRCNSDGTIVVQIINFESVRSGTVPSLGELSSADGRIRFERSYRLSDDGVRVWFETVLSVEGSVVQRDAIPLLVLYRDELLAMLKAVGFERVDSFGGFDASNWSQESFATVVSATH